MDTKTLGMGESLEAIILEWEKFRTSTLSRDIDAFITSVEYGHDRTQPITDADLAKAKAKAMKTYFEKYPLTKTIVSKLYAGHKPLSERIWRWARGVIPAPCFAEAIERMYGEKATQEFKQIFGYRELCKTAIAKGCLKKDCKYSVWKD